MVQVDNQLSKQKNKNYNDNINGKSGVNSLCLSEKNGIPFHDRNLYRRGREWNYLFSTQ